MSITEKQVCEEYRVLKFWKKGLENALYNARLMKNGSKEQVGELFEMTAKLSEINVKIDNVYREPIGDAIQKRIQSNIK